MDGSNAVLFIAGGIFQLASENQPTRFADFPNGHIITANAEANKHQFLKPNFYDPAILTDVVEGTKQPLTFCEALTIGSIVPVNAFTGPVLVITGEADLPFCGSDCFATGGAGSSLPAMVKTSFPNVSTENFQAVVVPNMAHGTNVHYNTTGAYDVIQNFLGDKGLASC